MTSRAVEIERKLATGEMLLKRRGRARITLWVVLVVGGITGQALFPTEWGLGVVVVLAAGYSLWRTAKQVREIEEGMIEYRGMRAGLSSKDDA